MQFSAILSAAKLAFLVVLAVFSFSQGACSKDLIVKIQFERTNEKDLSLFSNGLLLGKTGEFVKLAESEKERPSRIDIDVFGESEVHHVEIVRDGKTVKVKLLDVPEGCGRQGKIVIWQPRISVRSASDNQFAVNIGGIRYLSTFWKPLIGCAAMDIKRVIVQKRIRLESVPAGAEIFFGEKKTGYVTNNTIPVPLERLERRYSSSATGAIPDASLRILLRKRGFATESINISEKNDRLSVDLAAIVE